MRVGIRVGARLKVRARVRIRLKMRIGFGFRIRVRVIVGVTHRSWCKLRRRPTTGI